MSGPKVLLVRLTPNEPYFLGSVGALELRARLRPDEAITSLDAPNQAQLHESLRRIGTSRPLSGQLSEKDVRNVGPSAFDLTADRGWGFGRIRGISPLYLMRGDDEFMIRTPMDHGGGSGTYAPRRVAERAGLFRRKPAEPVSEWSEGWMSIEDLRCYAPRDLFDVSVRTVEATIRTNGAERQSTVSMGYKMLRPGCSFAFFAYVDDDFQALSDSVRVGQAMSPFRADWEEVEAEPPLDGILPPRTVYAQSDLCHDGDMEDLAGSCRFSKFRATRGWPYVTTARAVRTRQGLSVQEQGPMVIHAGSVFEPRDVALFCSHFQRGRLPMAAGLNRLVAEGRGKRA